MLFFFFFPHIQCITFRRKNLQPELRRIVSLNKELFNVIMDGCNRNKLRSQENITTAKPVSQVFVIHQPEKSLQKRRCLDIVLSLFTNKNFVIGAESALLVVETCVSCTWSQYPQNNRLLILGRMGERASAAQIMTLKGYYQMMQLNHNFPFGRTSVL